MSDLERRIENLEDKTRTLSANLRSVTIIGQTIQYRQAEMSIMLKSDRIEEARTVLDEIYAELEQVTTILDGIEENE